MRIGKGLYSGTILEGQNVVYDSQIILKEGSFKLLRNATNEESPGRNFFTERYKGMKKTIYPVFLLIISTVLASCCLNQSIQRDPSEYEMVALISSVPPVESFPDASIIYVLREKIEEVFEGGKNRETIHVVFKVISERGKGYANIKIGFNSKYEKASILHAKTTTSEGEVIHLKKDAIKVVTPYARYPMYNDYKQLTFSMPGVTVGAVVDYKVVREKKSTIIGDTFSGEYTFQMTNPTVIARYKVVVPKDMELRYYLLNPLKDIQLGPIITRSGARKTYLWEYRSIPQIITEELMPPYSEVAFGIMVTDMGSWNQFFDWWRRAILGKTEPNSKIREKVAELTKDVSSREERIQKIFDYVKRDIRYVSIDFGKSGYEPEFGKNVLENKYGDCKDKSTLLISMLKSVSIPAYYVLIPTSGIGNLIKDFPYPFQFDHCIVAVEKEDKYHFIDPVAETHHINSLPEMDQNRDVLIFKDRETIFGNTPLLQPQENVANCRQRITIAADGSIEGEERCLSSGEEEASQRSFFIDNNPTEIKELFEKTVDRVSPGGELIELKPSDPLNYEERFTVNVRYRAKNYCRPAGELLIFKVPGVEKRCLAMGKKDRRYLILIANNSYQRDEVEFNIPESHEVYFLPEPIEIANKYFEFRSTYQKEKDAIIYTVEYTKKAGRIKPEEYPRYQESCQVIEKSSRNEVMFRKKGY